MPIDRSLWNVRIRARDGIELAANVLLPPGTGPFPVLLLYSPYGRMRSAPRYLSLIERGYAMVFADMRGRGDSDGIWQPFIKQTHDAYDVIEWIGSQPWCSGRVGMIGASYEALTQWWAAAGRPPHLKCIVPQAVGCMARNGDVPFRGAGVPMPYWLWWMTMVAGRTMQNGGAAPWEGIMPTLPLRTLDERVSVGHSAWKAYVDGEIDFESAEHCISEGQMAAIDIPVLVGVGWWDDHATMETWCALQKAKSAKDCRLLIGAWDHGGNLAPRPVLGGVDVSASVIDTVAYIEKFLALHLKGEKNEMRMAPRCHVFDTGRQRWDDLEQWPPPGARDVSFYLASGGDARSLRGDGRLERTPTQEGAVLDSYTFDPNALPPTMTNVSVMAWSDPPLDHRWALRRQDVLVYDSEVLSDALCVSGRAQFDLFVSSDRENTDIFVSVMDVHSDGRSIALGDDGALRLSYREGIPPRALVPDEVAQVRIGGTWLHHVFEPGHRVRIAISSRGYPNYARNPGTVSHWGEDTVLLPQTNSIHHGGGRRSRVILPVAERL